MSNRFDVSWLNLNNQQQMNYLNDQTADIKDSKWSGNTLTYSFLNNTTDAQQVYVPWLSYANPGFTEVSTVNQNSIKSAMELISRLVNIDFEQTTSGNGNIQIGTHNMAVSGYSSFPQSNMLSEGVLMINKLWNGSSLDSQKGFNQTFIHELGHSLGLDHPTVGDNTQLLSMMSYTKTQSNAMGFSMLDILSLIQQYGVSTNTNGINYIYNNNAGNYNQSFVGNNYYINSQDVRLSLYTNKETYVPSTSTVFGTRGNDTLDLSATAGTKGVTYNGTDNAIYWLEDKLPGSTVYTSLTEKATITDDYRLPNIMIAPSDNVSFFKLETLKLTSKDDTIIIGDDFDTILAGDGNDSISGFKSGLLIDAGEGEDTLSLNGAYQLDGFSIKSGTDSMSIKGVEKVIINGKEYIPGQTPSKVDAYIGTSGSDNFTATTNKDTVDYSSVTGMMSVNLGLTTTQNTMGSGRDTLVGINNYIGGASMDSIQGNSSNNKIFGNAGNDVIRGLDGDDYLSGGLGNDLLVGGNGKDTFVFDSDLFRNTDTISDFKKGVDKIALSSEIFKSLGGTIDLGEFISTTGTSALDQNDHLIYQSTTGKLYYDQDGLGGSVPVHFATLLGRPTLTHDDFLII